MDTNFWRERWKKNDIGFHGSAVNPALVKYLEALHLAEGSRIFLPLCGKTLDIGWLLSQGYGVAGAELSSVAIEQLFSELKIKPQISTAGSLQHYCAEKIDIFVGDIFDLFQNLLGSVDAIYDRAALVALPSEMRIRYAAHLRKLTGNAPQLLLSFEYDQKLMEGPPFSVTDDEIHRHYAKWYQLTRLASDAIPGGLKGKCPAKENVWLLQ